MNKEEQMFIALGLALFSIFGSCVKWLNESQKKYKKIFSLVAEAASAAFSGILVYLLYAYSDLNIYLAFALAGIIGNQGAQGISIIGRILSRQVGVLEEPPDKKDNK